MRLSRILHRSQRRKLAGGKLNQVRLGRGLPVLSRARILVFMICMLAITFSCSQNSSSFEGGTPTSPSQIIEENPDIASEPEKTDQPKAPVESITKGSFTVYADPSNPLPFEDYRIVILVRLPSEITHYEVGDLKVTVAGTDQYHQELKDGKAREQFAAGFDGIEGLTEREAAVQFFFADSQGQLILFVPGAQALVEDDIEVSSNLLNERQNFKIVF